ncbi:PREDICTED: uncharacterized protein LOC104719426 [Camelina sativa]|uniref:Uncharacterized protein LOC104719426 n=1 Tax=Camelina sativa TaxID=90675 RepID=A0ABM0U4G3_CAMSA|nr:PREDICTED: uncharacterized protein LOC104719426 [Camelina sativa]
MSSTVSPLPYSDTHKTLMETFQHFSHNCPSSLTEAKDAEEGSCSLCERQTLIHYTCHSCKLDLCKLCSKLTPELRHKLHPKHTLEFHPRQPGQKPGCFICCGCGSVSSGSYYECKICQIKIDLECVSKDLTNLWDANVTYHYSHRHVLARCWPRGSNGSGSCFICERPYSETNQCYGCVYCLCFAHAQCLDLPSEIQHPVHAEHPLKRLNYMQHRERKTQCNACQELISGVPFGCLRCNFYLHMGCADSLLRSCKFETHDHELVYVQRNAARAITTEKPCNICHEPQKIWKNCYYWCIECNSNFHFECLKIPDFVFRKSCHTHPVQYKLFTTEGYEYCDVCETIINVGSYAYSCDCCFQAHIECILPKEKPTIKYLKDIYIGSEDATTSTGVKSSEHKLMIDDIKHTHLLTSCDLSGNPHATTCTICKQGGLGQAYKCEKCEFVAHDECAEVAQRLKSRFHKNHPLTLLPQPPLEEMKCDLCTKKICGFNLFCRTCDYVIHMECLTRDTRPEPKYINWEGKCMQGHNLVEFLGTVSKQNLCSVCGEELYGKSPSCLTCEETYHIECLEVEGKVDHPLHYHSLHIHRNVTPGSRCLSCGENINSYSYKCNECKDVYFHVNCTKSVEASLKLTDIHEHNLHHFMASFEDNTKMRDSDVIACSGCGKACTKYFYGCVKCKFYRHGECLGLPNSVRHRVHEHALTILYMLVSEAVNHYCEICLKAVDPGHPGYICKLCGSMIHPECALCWDNDWKNATEEDHKLEVVELKASILRRCHMNF